jgi:hypothetical protein
LERFLSLFFLFLASDWLLNTICIEFLIPIINPHGSLAIDASRYHPPWKPSEPWLSRFRDNPAHGIPWSNPDPGNRHFMIMSPMASEPAQGAYMPPVGYVNILGDKHRGDDMLLRIFEENFSPFHGGKSSKSTCVDQPLLI